VRRQSREAVRKAAELKPDVAIMDIVMPEWHVLQC
jgi:YesN/AraC family two-component response regulator